MAGAHLLVVAPGDVPETSDRWSRRSRPVPGTGGVHVPADLSSNKPGVALAHRVAREPQDARLHVERVNLHLGARQGDEAYGALIDLFIAYGRAGHDLRSRLLESCHMLIGDGRYRELAIHLEPGLAPNDPILPSIHSVLSRGVCGFPVVVPTRLVSHAASDNARTEQPDA